MTSVLAFPRELRAVRDARPEDIAIGKVWVRGDGAALAAKPIRAQVKFEVLESVDLLAHFEDPPARQGESGSGLTTTRSNPQSSGILQLFSIAAMSVGFVGLSQ